MDVNRIQKLSDDQLIQEMNQADAASPFYLPLANEFQRRQLATLQQEVRHLAQPHWVVWATFVAGAVAALAGVILLFRDP